MEYYTLPKPDTLPEFSLMDTITSGQTFQWLPEDSLYTRTENYHFPDTASDTAYLPTMVNDSPVIYEVIDNDNDTLQWRLLDTPSTTIEDPQPYETHLKHRLGFDFPYKTALNKLETADPALAAEANTNLSLLQDPPFPTLISFICSPQAPLSRIYTMMRNIEHEYGPSLAIQTGQPIHCFPTPVTLEIASEEKLRECNLGYRAPYVRETSNQVATDAPHLPEPDTEKPTSELRDTLTEYMGVGEKVADCVLLYAYNRTEVIPVDTRIQQIVTERYDETATTPTQAKTVLQDHLPEEYCGYYQLLLYALAGD